MVNIDRIKNLAKEKGIKLVYITDKLGISKSYFADVANGKTTISDDRLVIISDILDTTPAYLRGETDQKEKPDTVSGTGHISDDDVKVALFGGDKEVTDAMWKDVLDFVEFVKERNREDDEQ